MIAPLVRLAGRDERVLVGAETADDAGVYRFGDRALVATADFITPVCDDPHRFGRVAAANALSDVYAMGGRPLFALNLCCFPELDEEGSQALAGVLRGAAETLVDAGAVLLGGHSVRDPELKFGLSVVGEADPDRLLTNAGARPGDRLLLTKPLGVGIYSAALRKDQLGADDYRTLIDTTTRLNTPGIALAAMHGVHAITDVTGFGLAGHALEMARGAKLGVTIDWRKVPLLDGVAQMARDGFVTGASARNWAGYGAEVVLHPGLPAVARDLLTDPQTSGGLLVSCEPGAVPEVLEAFRAGGFDGAAVIGEVRAGPNLLTVRA